MSFCRGRYWITYNGEIYNYLELREQLQTLGHEFRTRTDTEVLIAAYAQWGAECLRRLNGMWSFAVWDRDRRELFAARDRFGKKPFYYLLASGRLYFASEMKALLATFRHDVKPNLKALSNFCAERISDQDEHTFIEGIHQLPAATWLCWRAGQLTTKSYWCIPALDPLAPPWELEEIRSLLEDAVRLRLRADTPVGCLVSGGLDSSTIACLVRAKRATPDPVHVFTTLTEPITEEARGVQKLIEQPGFSAHFQTPTAEMFWKELPRVLWHQEEPFADGSMVAHFMLMQEARAASVPVLLSGQGADEVFAGYVTYLWVHLAGLLRAGQFNSALRGMRAMQRRQGFSLRQILPQVGFHMMPRNIRAGIRRAKIGRELNWLHPDLRHQFKLRESYDVHSNDEVDNYLRNSIRHWTLPGFLHYEDRNSMAFGVETRLPYLDYRLVEALFRIPTNAKLKDLESKRLLREIARGIVPNEIVDRHAKQGYPAPLARWLRELHSEVRDIAYSASKDAFGPIDLPQWRQIVEDFLEGRNERLNAVWRGLICILWEQSFVRSARQSPRALVA